MASSTTFNPRQNPPKINGDLQDVARRVHQEFYEQLDATVVNASLERVSALFTDAKIRGFAPPRSALCQRRTAKAGRIGLASRIPILGLRRPLLDNIR